MEVSDKVSASKVVMFLVQADNVQFYVASLCIVLHCADCTVLFCITLCCVVVRLNCTCNSASKSEGLEE